MENKYQTGQGKYNLNLAEMTIDERLSTQPYNPATMGCQCKAYPCRVCRNRLVPSLDELGESEVEEIFSKLLVA